MIKLTFLFNIWYLVFKVALLNVVAWFIYRRGIPQGSLHDPYPSIETQPPLPTDFLATVTEALTR